MAIANQHTGSNLWVDGTNLIGQIKSIELPEVDTEQTEKMDLSGHRTRELPRRINAMECTITTSGYYRDAMLVAADNQTSRLFQIFSNIAEVSNVGSTVDRQALTELTGRVKTFSQGERNADDEIEMEFTIAVDTYKETYDGVELFNITESQHVVNGVDLLASRNANIGAN